MNELSKTEELVKQIFIEHPETLEDDNLLYHTYVKRYTAANNFERIFFDKKYMQNLRIKPYKTIERVARQLRAKIPEFSLSEESLKARERKSEEYIEYSRT